MPGSSCQGKEDAKEFIEARPDIKTILDIGPGSCTWPNLLGDKFTWYGIEIWKPYEERFKHKDHYRKVYYEDACKFDYDLLNDKNIDCVIASSVYEHFDRELAGKVLQEWNKRYRHIILIVPLSDDFKYESKIHYNNPFEGHKSYWKHQELKDALDWVKVAESKHIGIYMK